MRRRRNQVGMAAGLVVATLVGIVWLAAGRVGAITHQSALGVIGDVISGGGGSSVGQAIEQQRPITLALYGYGGDGHDGAYLSDSIMVIVIQPHAGGKAQVAEVSIPRDWEVAIDMGNGHVAYGKINEAYAFADDGLFPNRSDRYKGDFGRATLADDTLDKVLGIHIDHHVGLDFHAFQYAVDAVGGVDINVERTFTDHDYPNTSCDYQQRGCHSITVHFDAGMQHMDGARALEFARSRHGDNGEGSDFARSRRQQMVLAAVRQKVEGIGGLPKVLSVLDALQGHVDTDMTAGDSEQLYNLVKDVSSSAIEHVAIDDTNFLFECGYPSSCDSAYLWPRDATYASVSRFMAHVIPDPAALAEHATVVVQDASGDGGTASARWAQLLGEMGFAARNGGPVATAQASSVSLSGNASRTAGWLADYFQTGAPVALPATQASPSATAAATGADAGPTVTLVLGRDEEQAFNRDPAGPTGARGSSGGSGGSGQQTRAPRTQAPSAAASAKPTPQQTAAPTPAPTPVPTAKPPPLPLPTPTATPPGNSGCAPGGSQSTPCP